MSLFSIVFVNKSGRAGTVCLYQGAPSLHLRPDAGEGNELYTLAWFCKKTNPNTRVKFGWDFKFHFVWDDLIDMVPGRVVDAGEIVDAGDGFYGEGKGIRLSKKNGAYQFGETFETGRPGYLIQTDSTVPKREAVVGIGMAGAGTFVRPVHINYMYEFTPRGPLEYHIAFGDFETGQILDLEKLTCHTQVDFPPNVYSMLVTLNADDTWTVEPNRMLAHEEEE